MSGPNPDPSPKMGALPGGPITLAAYVKHLSALLPAHGDCEVAIYRRRGGERHFDPPDDIAIVTIGDSDGGNDQNLVLLQ